MRPDPIKVLLIDDEEEFTSTLAERLEIRGYTAVTAGDGEQGIQAVMSQDFDIAILDLMMPGMNGLDALKQIKSIEPDLPVILLTGHGSTKEGMEGMRIGAADYLMKPLDINELLEKIKQATKK
jgi:DNA-binding response OmpR family regulator